LSLGDLSSGGGEALDVAELAGVGEAVEAPQFREPGAVVAPAQRAQKRAA